ncbi:hypothetical protein ACFFU9_05060 [Mariniflexile ostreae]|uniref:Transposase n=1 Tax=Mariniflexile ostreae TaxID=1520892 RepID=A0ABV5F9I8_9FLAO
MHIDQVVPDHSILSRFRSYNDQSKSLRAAVQRDKQTT